MATINDFSNNTVVGYATGNEGYANTTTTPSFTSLEIAIKSSDVRPLSEIASSSLVLLKPEAELSPKEAIDLSERLPLNDKNLELQSNLCSSNSSTVLENSSVVDSSQMVQVRKENNDNNVSVDNPISIDNSTSDITSFCNGAFSNELPTSNSIDPLDNDENTTQIRLFPVPSEPEKFSIFNPEVSSATNSSSTTANHLFVEATLIAQGQSHREELNYSFMTSPKNDSDQDSIASLSCSNECNESACLSEMSTPLAVLEESSLDSGIASLDDNEQASKPTLESNKEKKRFMKLGLQPTSILGRKRRYKELSTPQEVGKEEHQNHSSKSKVKFDGVTVFYFPRKQSFVTVPSQGGSTLGMSLKHSHSKKMSLTQHKRVISRHRRKVVEQQKKQIRIDAKIKQLKQTYPSMEMAQIASMVADNSETDESQESSDEDDIDDADNVESISDDEFDDDNYFLQPVPAKKRRILLRMAGVQKIDLDEKWSNKLTRESREICGCSCENVCIPSSCQCALAGIPCQVDRESFPCGCVATGCCNPTGRVEFDSERVKKHYFRTMRKLRLQETGAILLNENEELPQPPKSPYVSSLERDEQNHHDEVQQNADNESSVPYSESATNPLQATYDQHLSMGSNSAFNFSSVEPWSGYNSAEGTSTMVSSANYVGNDMQNGTFDQFSCGQESYFDPSAAFCDMTSGFLTTEMNLAEQVAAPTTCPSNMGLKNFDSSFRDFSFAEEHFTFSNESKLSSVFAEGNQLGSRQTFKLDPITSFFPSNSRRMSQESSYFHDLPDSCSHNLGDVIGHAPINPSSASPQPCSIESLLCSDDQPASRSRSSSLSECSHDSVVKA